MTGRIPALFAGINDNTAVVADCPPMFPVQAEDDPISKIAKTAVLPQVRRQVGVLVERPVLPSRGHGFGNGRSGNGNGPMAGLGPSMVRWTGDDETQIAGPPCRCVVEEMAIRQFGTHARRNDIRQRRVFTVFLRPFEVAGHPRRQDIGGSSAVCPAPPTIDQETSGKVAS